MNSFSTDNADVAYSDRGEGEPVFLVHAGVFSEWFLPVSQTRSLDTFRVSVSSEQVTRGPCLPDI
jgi:hypothetical protein